MRMRIGVDRAGVTAFEICLLAIGTDQRIGVIARDAGTGVPQVTLAELRHPITGGLLGRSFRETGRLARRARHAAGLLCRWVGAYLNVEPAELEMRPNPHPVRAPLARLVLVLVLIALSGRPPAGTLAGAIAAWVAVSGLLIGRWAVGYIRREFVCQWRLALLVVAPAAGALAWIRWLA